MLKHFYFILFLLSFCLKAQETSLLWQITGKDIDTSYLFGTMHLADERILRLHENVESAIESSDLFVLELNMKKVNNPVVAIKLAKKMFIPKDTSLNAIYNKADYYFIKDQVDNQIPKYSRSWHRIKPMFVSVLFAEGDTSIQLSSDKPALDLYLYEIAKSHKIKHKGLEKMEEQMSAIDSIPLRVQAKMLVEQLKDTSEVSGLDSMIHVYMRQDIEELYDFMNEYDDYPQFEQHLLINRNYTMTDRFIEFAKKKRTFAGIGAGHLGGEEGVLNLLRQKGYLVKAIEAKFK